MFIDQTQRPTSVERLHRHPHTGSGIFHDHGMAHSDDHVQRCYEQISNRVSSEILGSTFEYVKFQKTSAEVIISPLHYCIN